MIDGERGVVSSACFFFFLEGFVDFFFGALIFSLAGEG